MANTETVSLGFGQANGTHTYLGDDPTSNYYLHHGDSPGAILVSQPLLGDNYHTWSRSMVMALTAKNKVGFMNEVIVQPQDESLLVYNAWVRCNTMVISWLLNSLSKEIALSVIYANTAQEIWEDLKERFIPDCSCGALKILLDNKRHEYVMQFLMGLNDSFSYVRAQILMTEPLPSITKAFPLVVQEERQRNINIPSLSSTGDSVALFTRGRSTKKQQLWRKFSWWKSQAQCQQLLVMLSSQAFLHPPQPPTANQIVSQSQDASFSTPHQAASAISQFMSGPGNLEEDWLR
uniref:Retrotransposon Copia-like N-terminal domain-containing protein n=1 Tax=Fagus sylvatica TaxID=28930 RepID=A0A2N9I1Q0_FAGSY